MIKILNKIESYGFSIASRYVPHTNVLGLGRSVLALGTLLTLLVNPAYYFFNKNTEGEYYNILLDPGNFPLNKFNFFLIFGPEYAAIMKWLAIVILLLVISGYFMKITSVLHWWVAVSFMLSSSIIDGGDQIAAVLSFFLIPVCLTDGRRNHWAVKDSVAHPKNIIAVLGIWLIRLQVAVIYLEAAVGKFPVAEWANGTALYYWLNHSVFGITDFWRPFLHPVLSNEIMVPLLTYGAMLLELCIFLGLVASLKYRKRILPVAIGFHFSIILLHGIFSFFFSAAAALILFLLPTYQNINFRFRKKQPFRDKEIMQKESAAESFLKQVS